MNLQAQIELINNPQDFTRLCNAVLQAEYGDDYLPIDDDRADRGNDGYLKSENRLFAGHCFKRIQNQNLDKEISTKMAGDLKKAVLLKQQNRWDIEAWTFLSNYPISEGIAAPLVELGKENDIDISWRGPEYFARVLQKYKSVRELFPNLMGSEIMSQLSIIVESLESLGAHPKGKNERLGVPHTMEQQRKLLVARPGGWEYLLFAGVLFQGKENLELKWYDHEIRYASRNSRYFGNLQETAHYLGNASDELNKTSTGVTLMFSPEYQERAFGPPGISGNPKRIEHAARNIIRFYEYLLDWAAEIRGCAFPTSAAGLVELYARLVDKPIDETRAFIDNAVSQADQIPEYAAGPRNQPLELTFNLTLTVDKGVLSDIKKETAKLTERLRRG